MLDISQFPSLTTENLGGEKRYNRAKNAITEVGKALDSGTIANPIYLDCKSVINNAFHDAWDKAISVPYLHGQKNLSSIEQQFDFYYHPEIHTVVGRLKKMDKYPDVQTEYMNVQRKFLREIGPLCVAFEKIKELVVKRGPKAAPEDIKAKYRAPEASQTAMKQIYDLFMALVDKEYNTIRDQKIAEYTEFVKTFMKKSRVAEADGRAIDPAFIYNNLQWNNDKRGEACPPNFEAYDTVYSCVDYARKQPNLQPAVLKKDYKKTIENLATKFADMIRESFVTKNLKKLDSIVEGKGDFDRAEIMGRTVSLSGLEGTFKFYFHSGASFVVRNSVVLSYSVHGKPFYRYPLTFHDVMLAADRRMPNPSEKRMNELFK
jgi:hypothetical protein